MRATWRGLWVRDRRLATGFGIASLSIGIFALAVVAAVIDDALLHPVPYQRPHQLVNVYELSDNGAGRGPVAPANLVDWQQQLAQVVDFAAYETSIGALDAKGGAQRVAVTSVSANVFSTLGVPALRGRVLAAGDSTGATGAVVVSEAFWRSSLGADPGAVGQSVTINGAAHTIVGVMAQSFACPSRARTDVWQLLDFPPNRWADRTSHELTVIGRLRGTGTAAALSAELQRSMALLSQQYPRDLAGRGAIAIPISVDMTAGIRPALLTLLGAAILVLLIACANAGVILVAQSEARERDNAIRAALGASPGDLIRQIAADGAVIGLIGGLVGLTCAVAVLPFIGRFSESIIGYGHLHVSPGLAALLVLVSLSTGAVAAVIPTWRRSSRPLMHILRTDHSRSASANSDTAAVRGLLLSTQTAIAFALLTGAALLVITVASLLSTPTGMQTASVITMHVGSASLAADSSAGARFVDPVTQRIKVLPDIEASGFISMLPLQASGTNGDFGIDGLPAAPAQTAEIRFVTAGYFDALRIPLKRGNRLREDAGSRGVKSVVVNEELARRYFPDRDPIGHTIAFDTAFTATIIGVVGNVRQIGLDQPPAAEAYFSLLQPPFPNFVSDLTLVVRTSRGRPEAAIPAIRRAVASVDPTQPVFDIETMAEVLNRAVGDRAFYLGLLSAFAAVALLLAASGVFGIVNFLVTLRTPEIGIRMALGARDRDVWWLLLRHLARWLALGLLGGVALSLGVLHALQAFVAGGSSQYPLVYSWSAVILFVIAIAACWIPAVRATAISPSEALRAA